jgi:hypothetical protein
MGSIAKWAVINSLSTFLYIVLLVSAVFFLGRVNPQIEETVFLPIGMLTLFVFSAALTSALVFGRPIMWYLGGKKKEAFQLLASTLVIILLLAVISLSSVLILS